MKTEDEIRERISNLKTNPPARKFGWDDEIALLDAQIRALEWALEDGDDE